MIDNYYKMLDDVKNFDDIKKIIILINGDISYYLKVDNKEKLTELRKLLHLIDVISLYVIKKKFNDVLPMLQEIRINMLNENRDKYKLIYDKLSEFSVMESKIDRNMSLDELNSWLLSLFELYKEHGFKVSKELFKDMFGSNITNYRNSNILFYEYMSLLLDLSDDDFLKDVDNDKMVNKIFELGSRGIISSDITDEIPGFDVIKLGISKFNDKYEEVIYREVNELSLDLGFGEIDSKNHIVSKEKIKDNISICDKKIKQINDGDISYILPEYEDMFISLKDLEDDIKIYELCNKISNYRYSKMDISERENFFHDLPEIMYLIIKYRLFMTVSLEYDKYATLNDYDEIKSEIEFYEKEMEKLKGDIIIQKQYCDVLLDKKTGIRYSLKKKDIDTKKAFDKFREINTALEIAEEKLKEFYRQRCEYIYNFNSKLKDLEFVSKYRVSEMNSMDKLFGVFPFEMLPIGDNINNIEILKKYGIKLPKGDSIEFLELSKLCLNLINSPLLRNRIDSNIRIKTDIDDKYLECLHDGKFDEVIDTISLDSNDQTFINKKRK